MSETTKYLLDESKLPRYWYNIAADLPKPAVAAEALISIMQGGLDRALEVVHP